MFRKKNILPPAEFADEERQELFNEKNKKSAEIRHFFFFNSSNIDLLDY